MHEMKKGRIGFLVKIYPKISETFVLEEILGLERAGLDLHIFSLRRPTDAMTHAATAAVRAPVSYPPSHVLGVLYAHLALALTRPRHYLAALKFALGRSEGNRVREFVKAGALVRPLRAAGVTHLHAHFASEPAGVAELVERLAGISYSISAHAKDIYLSAPESLRRKIGGARFTVTCTEYNRRYLAAVAGREARVLRMYHGVDLTRFSPGPLDAGWAPLIVAVGRLREKKGFAVLIEACGLLRDAGVPVCCEIIGYGEDLPRLRGLVAGHRLEDVVALTGKMTQDQVIARYRAATLFVLPCEIAADGDRDGIPNVLLEAMAMQLPVISTDVSGIPEVIRHEVNGLLVKPRDPAGLANAIRRLLGDAPLREKMGEAGRRLVAEMFNNDTNLCVVRELLLEAVGPAVSEPMSTAAQGCCHA